MYPTKPKTGEITADDVWQFLHQPMMLARRAADMTSDQFFADQLLTETYPADTVAWQEEDPRTSPDDVEMVEPGSEYPLMRTSEGAAQSTGSKNWGGDSLVTFESIREGGMAPVNSALSQIVNKLRLTLDGICVSAALTAITESFTVTEPWTTAVSIVDGAMAARDAMDAKKYGYNYSRVAVPLSALRKLQIGLWKESSLQLPLASDRTFSIGGLTFYASELVTTPMLYDAANFGGMTAPPGDRTYTMYPGSNVEVRTWDHLENDTVRIRARRRTAPIVRAPLAAVKIMGI